MAVSIIATLEKKNKDVTAGTVYIRGYYNRKPVASVSTGIKLLIEHWDPVKREVKKSSPNADLDNIIIQGKLQAMKTQLKQKEIMGSNINRQQVSKAVRGINDSADFLEFCTAAIADYERSETRRTYNSEVTKLQKFRDPISFSDIDYNFLTKYKSYMHFTLHNKPNTVWKSFKFICTMINKAIKAGGIILQNPFKEFNRGNYVQPMRKCLEMDHCTAIEKLCTHPNEMIRKVAIYFLLMVYSGMRFSDAMRFNPDEHVVNGRVEMIYQKFRTQVSNKIYTRLQVIIELLKANRLRMSNSDFNEQLKVIGGICNIEIDLTAHLGRHTMGGLLAEMEIPEEQARIILGQKDIRSTRIYYHVKNKNIDRAMDKLNSL